MRLPADKSLSSYIRNLIQSDNLILFYKSEDWQEVKGEVLEELHYECQHCLKRGRYTRADVVHHVNHVRNRPDLALSKYYTDKDGKQQRQLVPLCDACHAFEHPEKLAKTHKKDKFTNVERW